LLFAASWCPASHIWAGILYSLQQEFDKEVHPDSKRLLKVVIVPLSAAYNNDNEDEEEEMKDLTKKCKAYMV